MAPNFLDSLGQKALEGAAPLAADRATFYRSVAVPRTAVSAEGIYVTLEDESILIDAVGGAAVCSIGNGDDRVVQACADQMKKLTFVYSQQYTTQPAEQLADLLIKESHGAFERVAFVAGGSEANESAIKLVRQYWWQRGQKQRTKFIGRGMSYHGNTLAALSVGMHPTRRAPYEAIINHDVFHHVSPANYKHSANAGESEAEYSKRLADELEAKFLELGAENVAAFWAEPMVGATQGCVRAPKEYWHAIRKICDKYDVLLMLDEVMSGMWRMGTMFAYEEICDGVRPDILCCAKGLGSGYVSIGAMCVSSKVIEGINQGDAANRAFWSHGHTYTGHPVACAGALAVQKIIKEDRLDKRIRPLGERLVAILKTLEDPSHPVSTIVSDIRGHGLFWAVEFNTPETLGPRFVFRVHQRCLELGIVTLAMAGTTDGYKGESLMLAPAFVCTDEEIDKIGEVVVRATRECFEDLSAGKGF